MHEGGCGHRMRIWRRTGREEEDSWRGSVGREWNLVLRKNLKSFLSRGTMLGASMKSNNYSVSSQGCANVS